MAANSHNEARRGGVTPSGDRQSQRAIQNHARVQAPAMSPRTCRKRAVSSRLAFLGHSLAHEDGEHGLGSFAGKCPLRQPLHLVQRREQYCPGLRAWHRTAGIPVPKGGARYGR